MTWQDDLRALDEQLASGHISADEYRSRRDKVLQAASTPAGSQYGGSFARPADPTGTRQPSPMERAIEQALLLPEIVNGMHDARLTEADLRDQFTEADLAWSIRATSDLLDDHVLPVLRRTINQRLAVLRRTFLDVGPAAMAGLVGDRLGTIAVETAAVKVFRRATDRLGAGSVGVAGPRGVGKTTVIDHFTGSAPLKITVAAPVQYDAREFVLHLFARACHAVLAEPEADQADRAHRRRTAARFGVLALLGALLTWGLLAWWSGSWWPSLAEPDWWLLPAGLAALGTVAALARLVWLVLPTTGRALLRFVSWLAGRTPDPEPPGLADLARRRLTQIRYLQTLGSGWGGKAALAGAELNWTKTAQLAEQTLTYPEVVDALVAFLHECAARREGVPAIVVTIDELDKIESAEAAQRFINEIKGIFAVPGALFVVSISDDALASFERRGLPVRDAFDSAFQEVVRMRHLTLEDTVQLVNSWVVGVPEPFSRLVHCFAGGLPREVRRSTRFIVAFALVRSSPTLDEVCQALVEDDLQRKVHAVQISLSGLDADWVPFLRTIRGLRVRPDALLLAQDQLTSWAKESGGEFGRLCEQMSAYLYHCATLLSAFTKDRDTWLDAQDADFAARTLELLATAKQSLAVHPSLTRVQVDEFRDEWKLGMA